MSEIRVSDEHRSELRSILDGLRAWSKETTLDSDERDDFVQELEHAANTLESMAAELR